MTAHILSQDALFRFGNLRLAPIHGAPHKALEAYAADLITWLESDALESPDALCFLDITYFDLLRKEQPFTLIVGREANPERYWHLLRDLVASREFILGTHPVFRYGLPAQNAYIPKTQAELEEMRSKGRLKNAPSGILYRELHSEASQPGAKAALASLVVEPEDYLEAGLNNVPPHFEATASLDTMWQRFEARVSQERFLSRDGQPLRTLVAMPVGVRRLDDESGEYLDLANVYLGTAARWSHPSTRQLLRTLQLHILRSNAYHVGRGTGELETGRTFAHQAAGMLTGVLQSKSQLTEDASYKLEHLLRLTAVWTKEPLSEQRASRLCGADRNATWRRLLRGAVDQALYRLIERRQGSLRPLKNQLEELQAEQAEAIINGSYGELLENVINNRLGVVNPDSLPDWIESEAFLVAGHHMLCQAAYHALRFRLENPEDQGGPYLSVVVDSVGVTIGNRATPPGLPRSVTDDQFARAINLKAAGVLEVAPLTNVEGGKWVELRISWLSKGGSARG